MAKKVSTDGLKNIALNDKTFEELFTESYVEHGSTNNDLATLITLGIECMQEEGNNSQLIMQIMPNVKSILDSKIKNQESMTKLIGMIHKVATNDKTEEEGESDVSSIKKMIEAKYKNVGQQIGQA
jgi:hypothetical protein